MNGLLIVFTSDWQSKTESVNETSGKVGFPLDVWKGLFSHMDDVLSTLLKGIKTSKMILFGVHLEVPPPGHALTSGSTCSEWKVNEDVANQCNVGS